ncbi:DUF6090 family protein [Winogradskyella vincentii]|uniref:Germination protein YpeB n=1 Tax=Winogradskyella vincentii TaxID=2877122 RepID=A0ABS7Y2V1_9FLAO|nr:DUF6090 family protein [Winogradskyella vincentii]MCA0154270.1 germination protein YpeB [Winogradskyella vincentii]
MIKFFRHIRKSLLMENKTAKYFKYAIGEIVLVVIGILIALQINNSNELRKEKAEEAIILSDIREDFEASRLNFIETINNQNRVILNCRDLINAIQTKDDTIKPKRIIDKLYRGAFSHFREEAVLGSYDALIGSGKTSIIKNKQLLNDLADFSSQYKAGYEDETKSDNLYNLMMSNTKDFLPTLSDFATRVSLNLKKEYSTKEKEIAIKHLYENEVFLSYLMEKVRWEQIRLTSQKELLKSLNKVLGNFEPEKNRYSKYIGSYTHEENKYIDEVSYSEGSLYLHTKNGKWELVEINDSLFHIITWDAKINFITDEDSTTKLLFQFLDYDKVEFLKVNN